MWSNDKMRVIANRQIAEGRQGLDIIKEQLEENAIRALENSAQSFLFAAKEEIGEWLMNELNEAFNGKDATPVYKHVTELLHSDIMARSCSIYTHTSSEMSNMVQLARLQVRAQLYQRLTERE
jgi:hypothetical protein